MTVTDTPNISLPSTNWRYIKAKMSEHPQGTTPRPKGSARLPRKRRRDLAQRTQVTVTYRGGPEASFLVCFQDRCYRYPGWMALYDVMTHVCATIAAG